jgi:hypothetical protein
MNIGIVVEGDRDGSTYPELIRRIRNDIDTVLVEPCGNDARLMRQFVGWLKHFQWHAEYPIDKALVIMDSDCSEPSTWEATLRQNYEQSHFVASFPVHFHATKCEIETWLLADEDAINRVSQLRGKNKQVGRVNIQLEAHRDAKELFQKVLSRAGLPADARVYRQIASVADVGRIAARCPSFQYFVGKVCAC